MYISFPRQAGHLFLFFKRRPIQSAIEYRNYLQKKGEFVSLREKALKVPGVNRLKGAIHAYLWGGLRMTFDDVKKKNKGHNTWKILCREIVKQATHSKPTVGKRIKETIDAKYWKEIVKLSKLKYSFKYIEYAVSDG